MIGAGFDFDVHATVVAERRPAGGVGACRPAAAPPRCPPCPTRAGQAPPLQFDPFPLPRTPPPVRFPRRPPLSASPAAPSKDPGPTATPPQPPRPHPTQPPRPPPPRHPEPAHAHAPG